MYFIESKGILLYKVIISTLYESKYFIILILIVKYLQIYKKKMSLQRTKTINKSYQGRFLSPTNYKT